MEHVTEMGYKAIDTLSGMDLYDDCGNYVTSMKGVHLSEFMDENENFNDDRLDAMIETEMEAVEFLNDQANYMWKNWKKYTINLVFSKKLYIFAQKINN